MKKKKFKTLTPKEIVRELDKYIIGQKDAKRMVAIALRNRARRRLLDDEGLREEVAPKNIIMIGPTGVGKTEIARRLSNLAGAPFTKVEVTKYTEVGYVGRDVESMVRDLVNNAVNLVRTESTELIRSRVIDAVEERIIRILVPKKFKPRSVSSMENDTPNGSMSSTLGKVIELGFTSEKQNSAASEDNQEKDDLEETREKFRAQLKAGKLEDVEIEITTQESQQPMVEIFSNAGLEGMDINLQNMMGSIMPKRPKRKKMKISDARKLLEQEEAEKLIDMDKVVQKAVKRVEEMGIIFLDEIDKIVGRASSSQGPDVSREGVQRDILPIVEGSVIHTKYGPVRTDHILFIAAGAFHVSKPSDLIPELQGRFPIRVELQSLSQDDFTKILTQPKNALVKQYCALLNTEGVVLEFKKDGIKEISRIAFDVNSNTENIGARRLHTIMERLLEDISFNAPEMKEATVTIDAPYVRERLKDIAEDRDLSRYML